MGFIKKKLGQAKDLVNEKIGHIRKKGDIEQTEKADTIEAAIKPEKTEDVPAKEEITE